MPGVQRMQVPDLPVWKGSVMSDTLDHFIYEMKVLISRHSLEDEMVSVIARPLTTTIPC
jgi:hypothetical protein